jgi:hypothetical protein
MRKFGQNFDKRYIWDRSARRGRRGKGRLYSVTDVLLGGGRHNEKSEREMVVRVQVGFLNSILLTSADHATLDSSHAAGCTRLAH